MGPRTKRCLYLVVGVLVSAGPMVLALVQYNNPGALSELTGTVATSIGFQALAVLTYPAGVVGTLGSLAAILLGLLTPEEALVAVAGPVSLAAGYLQWFVAIPRIFGQSRRP